MRPINKDRQSGSRILLRLRVNGESREVATEVKKTLLEVLREDMALTGTQHGCELGECGTCAVLVDGKPVLSLPIVFFAPIFSLLSTPHASLIP
jgi:aerobic-type carbon monoxide dehydrogenase small subunit (CoxS/CutS family)